MYDIITVGSATYDVFVHSDPKESEVISIKDKKKIRQDVCFPLGSKILIKQIDFEIGGGGTNSAVSLSRLGFRVAFLGKVGKGENGKKILSTLQKEKVEFIGSVCDGNSGYSIILDSIADDRTLFTYKGVNDLFDYSEVDKTKLAASWFYFSSMTEKAYESLVELAEYAKKHKIKIMFNPSLYLTKKGFSHLKHLVEHCEILILNKEEAENLTKKEGIDKCLKELKKHVPLVIITDGKNGAFAYDGKIKFSVQAPKVDVVETTGAGDAFASAFLAGFIQKRNIEFALQLGMVNSVSVIQHIGAKKGLLTFSEAVAKIRADSPIVKQEKL